MLKLENLKYSEKLTKLDKLKKLGWLKNSRRLVKLKNSRGREKVASSPHLHQQRRTRYGGRTAHQREPPEVDMNTYLWEVTRAKFLNSDGSSGNHHCWQCNNLSTTHISDGMKPIVRGFLSDFEASARRGCEICLLLLHSSCAEYAVYIGRPTTGPTLPLLSSSLLLLLIITNAIT